MKKVLVVLALAATASTVQARDIAMREENLCYAVFDHIEWSGKDQNNRELARAGYNHKIAVRKKFIMNVDGIMQGKKELTSYLGSRYDRQVWRDLVSRCQQKVK